MQDLLEVKFIKIAEIEVYTEKDRNEIAEALENAGFHVAFHGRDGYNQYFDIIKEVE